MPYMKNGKRDYKKEYATYQGTEEQKKNRAQRNGARRKLMAEGVVKKGDGRDADHVKPIRSGGTNARSNLKAIPRSVNRSKK